MQLVSSSPLLHLFPAFARSRHMKLARASARQMRHVNP
jgi:hypothetical protein